MTTSKINLVVNTDEYTSFRCYYLRPIFDEYLKYTEYDQTISYDKSNTVFVTKSPDSKWIKNYKDLGYKIAFDNLWESRESFEIHNPNCQDHVVNCKNFFWYNESLWYTALGYNNYKPNKNYSKLAFMPLRMQKPHRDRLIELLNSKLDQLIYSYTSKNIFLPNDGNINDVEWERYFNPGWYNNTYFSIVAETTVDPGDIFVTEKTFKPLAFYHPFIILGQSGILAHIQKLGFSTFDNIFDESYDELVNFDDRLQKITNNINDFVAIPYDQTTLEKLEHNRNLFFNYDLVKKGIIEEIINPIMEFINE
jgi:hypothetical protein